MEEITDTSATLSWTRGLDNHSPISTYNLQARSPFSLGWQTVKTGNQWGANCSLYIWEVNVGSFKGPNPDESHVQRW